MGYYDALEDGIKTESRGIGTAFYLIPCSICGTTVRSWSYKRGTDYRCPGCRQITTATAIAKRQLENEAKRNRQLKTAVRRKSVHKLSEESAKSSEESP